MICLNNCGIYKIENMVNNKVYIGQSVNLEKRILTHKYELKNNKHDNIYLQNSFNKHGIGKFNFEIIELCEPKDLNDRETFWIISYKSFDRKNGYNIQIPCENQSYIVAEETKRKLREYNIKVTDEQIFKMIIDYFYKYDKTPMIDEFTKEYKGIISGGRVKARFNGFTNAVLKSGVLDLVENIHQVNYQHYTKEMLLKFLKNWINENDKIPTHQDIADSNSLPSITAYISKFKSLTNALEELGYYPINKNGISEDKALKMIYKLCTDLKRFPTIREIDNCDYTCSYQYYVTKYHSIKNACEKSGFIAF